MLDLVDRVADSLDVVDIADIMDKMDLWVWLPCRCLNRYHTTRLLLDSNP